VGAAEAVETNAKAVTENSSIKVMRLVVKIFFKDPSLGTPGK
jgi:hypothetical protein